MRLELLQLRGRMERRIRWLREGMAKIEENERCQVAALAARHEAMSCFDRAARAARRFVRSLFGLIGPA